ncbi:MAG: hypothetical protein K6T29_07535, partial [Peptococcaceae bacterium]|nr:hypothetical protein [Peptococcaceae bacterium]
GARFSMISSWKHRKLIALNERYISITLRKSARFVPWVDRSNLAINWVGKCGPCGITHPDVQPVLGNRKLQFLHLPGWL